MAPKEPSIPNEIWLKVLDYLPAKSLARIKGTSERFRILANASSVKVKLTLIVSDYRQSFQVVGASGIDIDLLQDPLDLNIIVLLNCAVTVEKAYERINSFLPWFVRNVLSNSVDYMTFNLVLNDLSVEPTSLQSSNNQIPDSLKLKLELNHIVDMIRNESSYLVVNQLEFNAKELLKHSYHQSRILTISNPGQFDMINVSNRQIQIVNVHTMIEFGDLKGTQSLLVQSDGRFLDREGLYTFRAFDCFLHHPTLVHLVLDGPWLESMVNYPAGVIETLKTMKQLRTLIVDFDQMAQGEQTLYSVITALPNLTHFGRLGRVSKPFWRLFKKQQMTNISRLEVGTIKYTTNLRKHPNNQFLKDLAFGVVWGFPSLKRLDLYLGFIGSFDTDHLLDVCKFIKESIPGFDRTIERVNMFQVTDFNLLQEQRWNYVAQKHGGGKPMTIYVTDDYCIDGKTGRGYRIFQ